MCFKKISILIFVEGYLFSSNRWYIIDKTPSSIEYCLILLSSALELEDIKINKMNNLIIDAANDKIFLMIIDRDNDYNISYENTKDNFEKLTILINNFLKSKDLRIKDISKIYVNRGPGSFAGIRNSLAVVKALHFVKKIDYFCFSFEDFIDENDINYENIPNLCKKFDIKKNLINPIYLS